MRTIAYAGKERKDVADQDETSHASFEAGRVGVD